MTEKKKKSVPPATEPAPIELEEALTEAPSAPVVPEAVSPIQIPKKVLEQAAALGIDLKQIVDWATSVEQKLAVAEKNFEQIGTFLTRMEPLVKLGEQIQQQTSPQPQNGTVQPQGLGNIGNILQMIAPFLGGGGDSEFAELGKKALMSQISMSTAITNAVVAKIAGKATTEVAEAVTGA